MRPVVRYARADDGVAIAWSTFGDGPIPVVVVAPLLGQLEVSWEEPAFEQFISRLAAGTTVVLFDRRNSGMSDRGPTTEGTNDLDRLAADVTAVLDAAAIETAVIFGISLGAATALAFADLHPSRVRALILFGVVDRRPGGGGHLEPDADVDAWMEAAAETWGSGMSVEADGPTMAFDERYRDWAARVERHTIAPGGFAAAVRASFGYDTAPMLPRISAPTLVLHRLDDQGIPVENGRSVAAQIPGARFVGLPGVEHTYFLGDQRALLHAIRTFLDDEVAGGALAPAVREAERAGAYSVGWDALTPGEREVAGLVVQGHTNAEVAERLHISPFTVDGRLRRIFAKLDVSTRVELAVEHGRRQGSS
jgi:pimeloyl-ACP methyl ester carboxylesterase/DNA-binding CsgD family transcriptional regulator